MINQQIMVYSVPRTGSTLIWQCLKKLFKDVLKAHRDRLWNCSSDIRISTQKYEAVLDYSCPCVITERDSMDSFFSQWRKDNWVSEAHFHEWLCVAYGDEPASPFVYPISEYKGWSRKNDDSQVFDMEKFKEVCNAKMETWYVESQFKPMLPERGRSIREIMIIFRKHLEDLEKIKKEYAGPILVLQYEQFWDDYDYIFTQFEEFFDIAIPEEIKTKIKDTTNRNVNKSIQDNLKGTQAHDTDTHMTGGHIFLGTPGVAEQVWGEKNFARIQKLLTCDFAEIMDIDLGE